MEDDLDCEVEFSIDFLYQFNMLKISNAYQQVPRSQMFPERSDMGRGGRHS